MTAILPTAAQILGDDVVNIDEEEGDQSSALEKLDMWKQEEKDFEQLKSYDCEL